MVGTKNGEMTEMWGKRRIEDTHMQVRRHIIFTGRVQEVGFRYRALYIAKSLELTGWVFNMWNGNVEMEVQGSEKNIEKLA